MGNGQDDYGNSIPSANTEEIAKAIVDAMNRDDGAFWISRDLHHRHHLFIDRAEAIEEIDNMRRRWIDQKMEVEKAVKEDRRDLKKKIVGALSVAGLLWLLTQVGESVFEFIDKIWP